MFANTPLPPAQSLLVVLGFAALIGLLFLVVKVVSLKMGGWKEIAERFPMRDVNFTGDSFKKQEGNVGDIGSSRRGLFDIRLATEGVCVYPFFARRNPCLIPWSAIRRVSVSDTSLLVVVGYERTFEFFLPAESLAALQANISLSLFHKAVSPLENAKAAIEDKATPRWMAWVASKALQSAENKFEKEKRKHDTVV